MISVDDLIGVRYRVNGRNIESGLDCYGMAIEVEKRFGHKLPDLDDIKKAERDYKKCEEKCLSLCKVNEIAYPKEEGDVIFFKDSVGVMNHIGVYLGEGRFIHCNKYGVHIEKVSFYKNMIGRVYTWL